MNAILLLFLLILFLSVLGFILNKAEIYTLTKKSTRMVKPRKKRHWNKIQKK